MFHLWLSVSSAATYEVGPGLANESLADVLSLVADGDIVEVAPGEYPGPYYIEGISLEIVGTGGASQTTLLPSPDPADLSPILVLQESASVTLRGFALDGLGRAPGLDIRRSTFVGEDLVLRGTHAETYPSLSSNQSTITVRESAFEGDEFGFGTHGSLLASEVTFEDVRFRGGHSPYGGGALYLEESAGTFLRCSFESNQADMDAGAVQISTLSGHASRFEDCLFERNRTPGYGAAILQSGGALTVLRSTFRSNVGRGAINQDNGAQLHVEDSVLQGNTGPLSGAGISTYNVGRAEIVRNTLSENTCEGDGCAINLSGVIYEADIAGNLLCANAAGRAGGAIALYSYGSLHARVHHNRFVANEATDRGGIIHAAQVHLDFDQNTVVDTRSGEGAVWIERETSMSAWNNALVGNVGGTFVRHLESGEVALGYNLLYDNEIVPSNLPEDPTAVQAEPGFVGYAPGDCGSDLRPAAGSALVDAGDPGLLDDDGSRSDIGAYGGEGAGALHDLGGDGPLDDGSLPGSSTPERLPPPWFCSTSGSPSAMMTSLAALSAWLGRRRPYTRRRVGGAVFDKGIGRS